MIKMNDYVLIKDAVTSTDLSQIKNICAAQFAQSTLLSNGYPGITLTDKSVCEYLSNFIPADIAYDFSFGTGANYVHMLQGRALGLHSNKPLYELDENFNVKPEYKTRVCVVTVIACLDGQSTIRITEAENAHTDVALSSGDVLVLNGGVFHELLPVEVELASFACGFYCTDL